MNWSDITSGYGPQMGGLLGGSPQFQGMFGQSMPARFGQLFANGSMGFQSPFPQYGGNTRSAQMMNNYMGGLLSRRQGYQPPPMPMRAPVAAPVAASNYAGYSTGGGYDPSSPVTGG